MTNKINTQRLLDQVKKNIKTATSSLLQHNATSGEKYQNAVAMTLEQMKLTGQVEKYSIVYDEDTQEFIISFQPTMALSYINATFDVSDGISPEVAAIIEE